MHVKLYRVVCVKVNVSLGEQYFMLSYIGWQFLYVTFIYVQPICKVSSYLDWRLMIRSWIREVTFERNSWRQQNIPACLLVQMAMLMLFTISCSIHAGNFFRYTLAWADSAKSCEFNPVFFFYEAVVIFTLSCTIKTFTMVTTIATHTTVLERPPIDPFIVYPFPQHKYRRAISDGGLLRSDKGNLEVLGQISIMSKIPRYTLATDFG